MKVPTLRRAFSRRRAAEGWLVRVSVRLSKSDVDRLGSDAEGVRNSLAQRVAETTRPGDDRSVLASDEYLFVVKLGRRSSDSSDPVPVVRRLMDALAKPVESAVGPIFPRLNAAFTSAPCDASDEQARGALAVALNEAERAGSGIAVELDLRNGTSRHLTMDTPETETVGMLKRSIDAGQVVMHYQPIVRLRDGHVTGFEALMRVDGDDGMLGPAGFIGAAERSGLIHELGRIAFREAAAQMARWRRTCGDAAPLRVAVNVSPRQLASPDFTDRVAAAFAGIGLDSLTLEMTETALIHEMPEARETLQHLRDAGAWVALDDFGVEYSNLAYLRDLAVDVVKIDRSFLEGASETRRAEIILTKIVELAHLLDAKIVAEGVATEDQRRVLNGMSVDYGQGSLFGPPVDGTEAEQLLRAS